jgi:crotonobetainyl-CoA:carnitine CoA-transferase CaiB-like acyl-CoA transferase
VDPETLQRHSPGLICASITGFGKTGPYADRAAHDINYEALAGLLALHPGPPQVPGLLIGDIGAAYQTTMFVLAALLARARSGIIIEGTLDVSIHEAALQWMVFPSARRLVDGGDRDPRQLPLHGEAARYNVYQTSDGKWLALGALEAKFWVGFCEKIGRPDLSALHDTPGDEQSRALAEVRAIMKTRTRDDWLAHFADVDVCLTAINSVDEALDDPHVKARGRGAAPRRRDLCRLAAVETAEAFASARRAYRRGSGRARDRRIAARPAANCRRDLNARAVVLR